VYGHYLGEIHPKSRFAERARIGWVQHGWVILPDGRVFDPTRWVFEAKKPYLYVGDDEDYDEGGSRLREHMLGDPPDYDPSDKQVEIPKHVLPTPAWNHVEKLLEVDVSEQEPGVLSFEQVRWLAKTRVENLQPHAGAVYAALRKLRLQALIPIDNVRKVERLSSSAEAAGC
jgi:hypothetical protein